LWRGGRRVEHELVALAVDHDMKHRLRVGGQDRRQDRAGDLGRAIEPCVGSEQRKQVVRTLQQYRHVAQPVAGDGEPRFGGQALRQQPRPQPFRHGGVRALGNEAEEDGGVHAVGIAGRERRHGAEADGGHAVTLLQSTVMLRAARR
jgi:hypothetical protein